MRRKKLFIYGMSAIICVICIAIITKNSAGGILGTNAEVGDYSKITNKKIAWGIKRSDNHDQPDVGSENLRVMNEYNGLCMGNKDKKYVYLTFDCGYEAGYTESIIKTLKSNEVTATFFITGHYLNTASDNVKLMIDNGNIVGNHTVNHKNLTEISLETLKDEVMNLHTAVYEKFGYEMKYIRPPEGVFSERTIAYTNSLGYTSVMWSLAYDDWDEKKQGREGYGKQKILDNIHNGSIILLHANSKDNCAILDEVIKKIKEMGYEIKSLDDFVG